MFTRGNDFSPVWTAGHSRFWQSARSFYHAIQQCQLVGFVSRQSECSAGNAKISQQISPAPEGHRTRAAFVPQPFPTVVFAAVSPGRELPSLPSVNKGQYACQRPKSTLAASSSSVGGSPPSSSFLPAPVFSHWQIGSSFSGAGLVAGKADEAAGLTPGNEDNAASSLRCPEKPYCLLSTEGI